MLDAQPASSVGEQLTDHETPKPLKFEALKKFTEALLSKNAKDPTENTLSIVVVNAAYDLIIRYDAENNVDFTNVPNELAIHPYMEALHHLGIETESYFENNQVYEASSDLVGLRKLDVELGSKAGDLYVLAGLEAQMRAVNELCPSDDLAKFNLALGLVRRISGDESITTLINPNKSRPAEIEQVIQRHMNDILNTKEFMDIKKQLRDKLPPNEQGFIETLGLKSHAINLSSIPIELNRTPHTRLGEMDARVIDVAENEDLQLPPGMESNEFSKLMSKTFKNSPKPPPSLYAKLLDLNGKLSNRNISNIFPPRFAAKIERVRQESIRKIGNWQELGMDQELVGWIIQQMSDRIYPLREISKGATPEFRMVYKATIAPEVISWWAREHQIKEVSISFIGPSQLKPTNIDHGHVKGDHVLESSINFTYEISDELIRQTAEKNNLDILIFKSRGSTICVTTPQHTIALQKALYEAQIEKGNKLAKLPEGVNENNQPLIVMTGAVPGPDGYTPLSTIQVEQDPIQLNSDFLQAVDQIRSQHYYNEKLWMMLFRPDVFLRSTIARVSADAVNQISLIYEWIVNQGKTSLPFQPTISWTNNLLSKLKIDVLPKSPPHSRY